jgi:hypothetical protein
VLDHPVGRSDYADLSPLGPQVRGSWRHLAEAPIAGSAAPVAVWTGKRLLVLGRGALASYDPDSNRWRELGPARPGKAAWTGRELLVWGGVGELPGAVLFLADGGRYDPATDAWTPISTAGAPAGRAGATGVWTGRELLVWGGVDAAREGLGDGAAYDPVTDTWTALPTDGAPSPRVNHTAVWTGRELLVWGGSAPGLNAYFADGAAYDPAARRWRPLATEGGPGIRLGHTAVWTGRDVKRHAEVPVWRQRKSPGGARAQVRSMAPPVRLCSDRAPARLRASFIRNDSPAVTTITA